MAREWGDRNSPSPYPNWPKAHDKRPIGRELGDATLRIGCGRILELGAVGFAHEDASIRGDQDVVRIGEVGGRVAGLTGRPQDHEHLTLGAELDHGAPSVRRIGVGLYLPGICEAGRPLSRHCPLRPRPSREAK